MRTIRKPLGVAAAATLLAAPAFAILPATAAAKAAPTVLPLFGEANPEVVNYNTNWFTKFVEKKFNLKITWNLAPASDVATKQSLLFASGNYPPVVFSGSLTQSQAEQYGHEGILRPLNKLLKQYAPVVWKVMQTSPSGLKRGWTAPNGEIYAISGDNLNWPYNWPDKLWINTTILNKYKLKIPTTTAQFMSELEVLKKHGITGIEGATEQGTLTGGWHSDPSVYLMNAFIYDDGTDLFDVTKNKQLDYAPVQPQWRQGLEYMHELYAKGLIAQGAFTQSATLEQRADASGNVFAFAYGDPQDGLGDPSNSATVAKWIPLPPLTGPDGVHDAAINLPIPTTLDFAISTKATKAQTIAALKLLNYMWTPVGSNVFFEGPEGLTWKTAPKGTENFYGGQAQFLALPESAKTIEQLGTHDIWTWGDGGTGPVRAGIFRNFAQLQAVAPLDGANGENIAMPTYETIKYKYSGSQPTWVPSGTTWIPAKELQQYSLDSTNITNYVDQYEDEFITGKEPLTTASWNAYVSGLKNLGLPAFVRMSEQGMGAPINTKIYDPNMKVFHVLSALNQAYLSHQKK